MRNTILEDLKTAMKNQDKFALSVIRMVKGAMQLEEINAKKELNDDEIITIITKQIKTRKESIVEFEKGNRNDLIESAIKEIEFLKKYLPEQLTTEELNGLIEETINKIKPKSSSDMGLIMKEITPLIKGKADMKEVSNLIKQRLENL